MIISETGEARIDTLLEAQRTFFAGRNTRDIRFRTQKLALLSEVIRRRKEDIAGALRRDLSKSSEESYLTEISIVQQEIELHRKNLASWSSPKRTLTPMHLLPSTGVVMYEPLGVTLIISPWNYPFQLVMNPLIGAVSAGNCALLKPSPDAPHTARIVEEIVDEVFDPGHVAVVQGGRPTNEILLSKRFDLIFFTGSSAVGKVVMKAAAEYLTPVVLELGGKSPCIVDTHADVAVAARRIAWGKTINAGQTCIAPDYVLVQKDLKESLIRRIGVSLEEMHGSDMRQSPYYGRIIHHAAYERLTSYLEQGTIRLGGDTDAGERYIQPTILDNIAPDAAVMQDEIFGPILPVIGYDTLEEAVAFVNKREKPLALYYFGDPERGDQFMRYTSSGGACINDTIMHIANHYLPFGGVGNSGMGRYHGRESFLAFSHQRSVLNTPTLVDIVFRYPPFKYFDVIRRIV
ncbi:MAG: aldehyde dehydrogenase [Balneolales bacterium]|nr:aldehyde dehydrogenase [Balneolales bacterium]